jgi:SpoVK/Ycf46/Vps4 family AAA+-type ATPase
VESLPPELLRKGRFSEIWGVVEPDPVERADIWRIHLRKVRPERVEDFDYSRLVAVSANFTGAEIESAVEEAMFDAWEASRDLTTEDLVTAVAKFVPQADTCKERIDVIRNWMQQKVRFVAHSKVKQKEDETSQSWRKIRAAAEQSTKPEAAVDSAVEKGEPKKGLH